MTYQKTHRQKTSAAVAAKAQMKEEKKEKWRRGVTAVAARPVAWRNIGAL